MENQVLSIEQMQELEKLGIDTSNASMFWYRCYRFKQLIPCSDRDTIKDWTNQHGENCIIPTFTLQDILEILPSYKITYDKFTNDSDKYEIKVNILEGQHYITHIAQSSESLLKAAFTMLKWCKQNNYI